MVGDAAETPHPERLQESPLKWRPHDDNKQLTGTSGISILQLIFQMGFERLHWLGWLCTVGQDVLVDRGLGLGSFFETSPINSLMLVTCFKVVVLCHGLLGGFRNVRHGSMLMVMTITITASRFVAFFLVPGHGLQGAIWGTGTSVPPSLQGLYTCSGFWYDVQSEPARDHQHMFARFPA